MYNGQETGVMHACGHDTHISILMGVAEILSKNKDKINGSIKFIFQPAEEGAPPGEEGGAELMVKEGVLKSPDVDAIFGLHIGSGQPAGTLAYRPGGIMAAVNSFEINVKGKQTHGSRPWAGVDPIMASVKIIDGLQTLVSREMDLTKEGVVLSIGKITSGVRSNIIPENAQILGTLRTLDYDMQAQIKKRMGEMIPAIAKVYTSINTNVESLYSFGNKTFKDFATLDYLINYKRLDTIPIYQSEGMLEYFNSVQFENDNVFDDKSEKQNPVAIESWQIPHVLFLLENFIFNMNTNDTHYYNTFLNPNPDSELQNEIARKIVSFSNNLDNDLFTSSKGVSTLLKEVYIPEPTSINNLNSYNDWNSLWKQMYSIKEIEKVENLLQSDALRAELRTLLLNKFVEFVMTRNLIEEGENLLQSIKEFNPNVKLNYPNIGIVGDAVDDWLIDSTPLTLTDAKKGVWELELYLKNGHLKFRSDNNWTHNWGGTEFPKARAKYWGSNIPITEGNYHIILNLTENTYEFIKLDD